MFSEQPPKTPVVGSINQNEDPADNDEFASGGNWGSRSVFLQRTGEFSESGEVPQIPMTFLQCS